MKLSAFKNQLSQLDQITFQLPDGSLVPSHFHVTEVGKVVKHFIDCGGKERLETVVNFQLWEANDYDHRLHPEKLQHIIELSESRLGLPDVDIEVEYQSNTIGKYGIDFNGTNFILTSKLTDCLAKDKCGIPEEKLKIISTDNQTLALQDLVAVNFKPMYTAITELLNQLDVDSIPLSRKRDLDQLSTYINQSLKKYKKAQLTFICTHNSRRSHLCQIWAQVAARHFDIPDVYCYSGGTEPLRFIP